MKALIANKFYYNRKGSETYVHELVRILEGRGDTVLPFSMRDERNWPTKYQDNFISRIDYSNISTMSLVEKASIFFRAIYSIEAVRKIRKIIKSEKPDIAIINSIHNQISPSILHELKNHGVPVVYTIHEYSLICPNYRLYSHGSICEKCRSGMYFNCFLKKCLKDSSQASLLGTISHQVHSLLGLFDSNIDAYIAPSKFIKDKHVEWGFNEDKIHVINNPLDVSGYTPSKKGDYGLYLGGLYEEKGVLDLLEIFKNISVPLKIAGDGTLKDVVQDHARRYDNIEYLGFQKDIDELVSNSMFTFLFSRWWDNYPYSILESFAYGKPVVASNIGGIPEIVDDGVNGILVAPGEPENTGSKILSLYEDKQLRDRMGVSARKKVEDNNSPDKYYHELTRLYESLF